MRARECDRYTDRWMDRWRVNRVEYRERYQERKGAREGTVGDGLLSLVSGATVPMRRMTSEAN